MKPKKTYSKRNRTTVREMMRWAMAKTPTPKAVPRADRERLREVRRINKYRSRRWAVKYIRAFIGPHFFAGCFTGAENE
jgi:hypothetical protein